MAVEFPWTDEELAATEEEDAALAPQAPVAFPGYVGSGGARDPQFWEDNYRAAPERPAGIPAGVDIPDYVQAPAAGPSPTGRPLQFWEDPYEYQARGVTPEEAARATVIRQPQSPFGTLPLGKFGLEPQEVEAGMETIFSPFLSEADRRALMEAPLTPSPLAESTSGLSKSFWNQAEAASSLPNIGMMAGATLLGGVPIAARIVSGGFAADMASQFPELWKNVTEAYQKGDRQGFAKATGDLAAVTGMTVGAVTHLLSKGAPVAPVRPSARVGVPESMRAFQELQPAPGEPNAIQERQATAPVRGLPEQPVQNVPLPAEEGAQRVPPGGVPPGNEVGAPRAEEAGPAQVPLAEERFSKAAEPAPVPEKREMDVVKMGSSQHKGPQGDPLGTTYRASPEDWARWQDVQAGLDDVRKGAGMDDPRFPELWKENERIKNNYGGMPPEAPRVAEMTETSPIDHKAFTTTDAEGYQAIDVDKLQQHIKEGKIKGDKEAVELLNNLLTPSEAHPLKSIRIIDQSPQTAQIINGREFAYKGVFRLGRNTPEGTIEILTRNAKDQPVSHAEFIQTLNHELEHNAITSKLPQASPEIRADLNEVVDQARARAKGTDLENHNAFSNEHEFMAELKTDPKINKFVAETNYQGKGKPTTLLGRISEIVHRLFGSPKNVTINALEQALRIRGELEPIKREAQGAAEERLKPAEEERKGLPMAPRAGEAGAINLPMSQHISDFLQEVPGKVNAGIAALAGKSAPATSTRSVASGNALVRYASAKIAAPEVAKSMATEVLGNHYKDAAFGKKLGAVLVEDRLRGMKDAFTKAGDQASADKVNSIIGQKDSPLKTDADFTAALADPEIQAAIQRHKQTVQPTAEKFHQEAGGKLAGPGLNTGAFVNLKAIFEGNEENLLAGGGRGNLMNPLRRPSKFGKEAKGTGTNYEIDYRTVAQRMIEGNFEEHTKRQMYDQLVKDGLAQMLDPDEPAPEFGGRKGEKFTIERKGVPAGENKARTYVKNLWVDPRVASEVRQALNVDGKFRNAAVIQAVNLLNKIQLAGPTDAVWHTANMIGSIAGSQGGKSVLVDLARKLPGYNLADAVGRVVKSGIEVLRDTPEIQKQIAELAEIGAMRGHAPAGRFAFNTKLISLVDKAGRLVRDNLYKNLVDRGLIKDTEAARREWVNQMGQYNGRLMGQFQRFFKEAGFSPFVVAGRNFNRMAMRRLTLDPGVKAASPAAAAQMRAVEAFGTIATLFAIPALVNWAVTGSPSGRPGTKQGQIDTGKDINGKHVVIDPAQWTGLRRGLRISGAQSLIEGLRSGERGKVITKNVLKDIAGGITHPWTGPAVQAEEVGRTGSTFQGFPESENPKDIGANVRAAAKQLSPVVNAIFKGSENKAGWDMVGGAAKEFGKSLGGAAGFKTVKPFTKYDEIRNLHSKWLENNENPAVRADFARHEAETFQSQYKALDKALDTGDEKQVLQAIEELRPMVKEDAVIRQRMQPYSDASGNPHTLFHGSRDLENKFKRDLTDKERDTYDEALDERKDRWQFFLKVWRERGPRPTAAPAPAP